MIVFFLFICLFQFDFMFLSEDRGKIRVEDNIKKNQRKREVQKQRKNLRKAKSTKNGTCISENQKTESTEKKTKIQTKQNIKQK